jgi:hypothetical protein
MDEPKKGWFYYIKKLFSSKKAIGAVVIVLLIIAVPATVYLVEQQQEIRQRAQEGNQNTNAQSMTYPWNYRPTTRKLLPVAVSRPTKTLLSSIPFSSATCPKRSQGDADCNNTIDLSDLSYWQIDYEKGTTQFANFNGDKTVDLADYAIWRKNATIPVTPVIQKVAEKLWLDKLFAFFSESFFSFNRFKVYAQQTTSGATVTSSTVSLVNDLYSIVNSYTDGTYAVQTISPDSQGGSLSYYDSDGNPVLQVSNFLQDTATTVTQVGANTVSITNTPNGPTLQTIQDANGSFISSQIWPSFDAYTRNDSPQAATIPVTNGFATTTIVPNKGAIVVQRDGSGKTTSVVTINSSVITITNYQADSYVYSNSQTNEMYLRIRNNIGGTTTYSFTNLSVTQTTVTDNKGNTSIITDGANGQYHIVTKTRSGDTTEQDVADPMQAVGVTSPSPLTITQDTQAYNRQANNNSQYSFLSLFSTSGSIPVQLYQVDQILAAQNRSNIVATNLLSKAKNNTAVLGVKTGRVGGKVLLAQDSGLGDTNSQPSDGGNSPSTENTGSNEAAAPGASDTGTGTDGNATGTENMPDTNTNTTNDSAPDRPGNFEVDTSGLGDIAGENARATANEDGTWSASGIDANGNPWSDSGSGAADPAGQALAAFYSHNEQAGIENVSEVSTVAEVGAAAGGSSGGSGNGSTASVPQVTVNTPTQETSRADQLNAQEAAGPRRGGEGEPESGQGQGSYPASSTGGGRRGGEGEPESGQGQGSHPAGSTGGGRQGGEGEPEPGQGAGTYPSSSGDPFAGTPFEGLPESPNVPDSGAGFRGVRDPIDY